MKNDENIFRDLMDEYWKQHQKLTLELKEAKEDGDDEAIEVTGCLLSQCRKMTAQLFKAMSDAGFLDEEEIEFGSTKKR